MKRRNDAFLVTDLLPYKKIFPFIMKRRSDSVVYHSFTVELTEGVSFIKQLNKFNPGEHQYRVFELILAALMRTIVLRPWLNRFIMNYRVWQRKELSLNFVVKEDYTDEAPEHSTVIYFQPDMTFPEMASLINSTIVNARQGGDNDTDRAINFFLKFPTWFIRMLVGFAGYLDRIGRAPQALRDADGLHCSLFVANLGSISLPGSPHHHLYEWGTCSIFTTLGKMRRQRITDEEGNLTYRDVMEISVTVDERIADGFYFIKSMQLFQELLNNPERLLERPAEEHLALYGEKLSWRKKVMAWFRRRDKNSLQSA